MNSRAKRLVFSIALAMMVAGLPAQVLPLKLCCVAGEYKGSHVLDQMANCPVPASESFTMTLLQAKGCGASVWGKIVDAAGNVRDFVGTLSRGPRGCCKFQAKFSDPHPAGHVITLTGTFCMTLGKWRGKGTYVEVNSGDPCKKTGSWKLEQI